MREITEETRALLEKVFGTPAVDCDGKTAIFNMSMTIVPVREIRQIGQQTRQMVEFSLHGPGTTARIADRVYVFGIDGKWHRQQRIGRQ